MKRIAFLLFLIPSMISACGSDSGLILPDGCIEAAECNDNNPCTIDGCGEDGACTFEQAAVGTSCDDNLMCTDFDACDVDGACVGTERACTGQVIPCVENACNPNTGECGINLPNGSQCDFNENDCTTGDSCQDGQCIVGDTITLDDQNPCTQDACVKGEVVHEPLLEGQCDDDNECTVADSCHLGTCVGGEPVECVIPTCGAGAECVQGEGCVVSYQPTGSECDDNDACSLVSVCNASHECVGGGSKNCDDGNECTEDFCAAESGCTSTNLSATCDDGDPCTTNDACASGLCSGHASAGQGQTVDCSQGNAFSEAGCCCWKEDPLNVYKSGYVFDLAEEFDNVTIEVCMKPGGFNTCSGTTHVRVAGVDEVWHTITAIPTLTQPTVPGGTIWQTYCHDVDVPTDFRYVHIADDFCWLDYGSATPGCALGTSECSLVEDCDDDNACTADSCDATTGSCINEPIEADWCLTLREGNNLVSFSHLPEDASIMNVLGTVNPYARHLFTEAKMSKNYGEIGWVGNVVEFERTRSYWIYMDYPPGTTKMTIALEGDLTDSDLKYPIHAGRNMVSYPGDPMSPGDALPDDSEDLFTMLVGEGVAAIPNPNGDGWVGSLSTFKRNKGYQWLTDGAISNFGYESGDGVDPYSYGCTHAPASNYAASAQIDDGSCAYDLPENWGTPFWTSYTHHQSFVIFYDLTIDGAPLDQKDAVSAIVNGAMVGVGFPEGNRVTVPAIGDHEGQSLSFELYDHSTGTTTPIVVESGVDWTLNGFQIAACTDESKSNYVPIADLSIDVCAD